MTALKHFRLPDPIAFAHISDDFTKPLSPALPSCPEISHQSSPNQRRTIDIPLAITTSLAALQSKFKWSAVPKSEARCSEVTTAVTSFTEPPLDKCDCVECQQEELELFQAMPTTHQDGEDVQECEASITAIILHDYEEERADGRATPAEAEDEHVDEAAVMKIEERTKANESSDTLPIAACSSIQSDQETTAVWKDLLMDQQERLIDLLKSEAKAKDTTFAHLERKIALQASEIASLNHKLNDATHDKDQTPTTPRTHSTQQQHYTTPPTSPSTTSSRSTQPSSRPSRAARRRFPIAVDSTTTSPSNGDSAAVTHSARLRQERLSAHRGSVLQKGRGVWVLRSDH
jgi:hypothetical protein